MRNDEIPPQGMELKPFVFGWFVGAGMISVFWMIIIARKNDLATGIMVGLAVTVVMLAIFMMYQFVQARMTIGIQQSDNYNRGAQGNTLFGQLGDDQVSGTVDRVQQPQITQDKRREEPSDAPYRVISNRR